MATAIIKATNDGFVYNPDAVYVTARDAIAGDGVVTAQLTVGQRFYSGTTYGVYRPFVSFPIPNMATLISASLFLEGKTDVSTADFDIYLHESIYSDPLVKEDFDLFDGHQASGAYNGTILNNAWNTKDYSDDRNEIVFNADGLAAVLAKKDDTLKIALISKEDYDNSTPTGEEYCVFESSGTAGKEPFLFITYTIPGFSVSAAVTLEMEASATPLLTMPLSALVEVEAVGTNIVSHYFSQSVGGSLTPTGLLSAIMRFVMSVGGNLDLTGEFSAHNPAWLLLDDTLTWKGEWDETTSYDLNDTVLHYFGNEWHVFISKAGHNTGHVPVSSAEYWRRLYQEQWI